MGLAKFSLSADGSGRGRLVVNGQDVSNDVAALDLHMTYREPPRLIVHMHAEGSIEGEGIVETTRPATVGEVAEMILRLDPKKVEAEALRRMPGMGSFQIDTIGLAWLYAVVECLAGEGDAAGMPGLVPIPNRGEEDGRAR